jgi:ubiquinone/menaquinone biosynthesis C-methylase UbiE
VETLGKFNTDVTALERRIQAHEKYGSNDLTEWIFCHLNVTEGLSILDLGCGTGKQTIPLAQAVGKAGRVLSLDISQDALNALTQNANKEGLAERITTLCSGLDDFHNRSQNTTFDRILSAYALYYANNPENVIKSMWNILKSEGVFFFCGPSKDNNRELKGFHYGLKGKQGPTETRAAIFMEDTGPRIARKLFRAVRISVFENTLRFDSAEALYAYWSSYNLYEDDLDESFRRASAEHFSRSHMFITKKRVIGVKAEK